MISELPIHIADILHKRADYVLLTDKDWWKREQKTWQDFFGKEIDVPLPPREMREIMYAAYGLKWPTVEPVYIPLIGYDDPKAFDPKATYPGWWLKPDHNFWQMVEEGQIGNESVQFGGYWAVYDVTTKPDVPLFGRGRQMYKADLLGNDPFGRLLAALRGSKTGLIAFSPFFDNMPKKSRFALSPDEIDKIVLPEILQRLGVDKSLWTIRLPKTIEYSLLTSRFQKKIPTLVPECAEWFADRDTSGKFLAGGNEYNRGIMGVYTGASNTHDELVGFRPIIIKK